MCTDSNTFPAERHCSCGVQRKTWSDGTTLFLNGLAVEHQSPLKTQCIASAGECSVANESAWSR